MQSNREYKLHIPNRLNIHWVYSRREFNYISTQFINKWVSHLFFNNINRQLKLNFDIACTIRTQSHRHTQTSDYNRISRMAYVHANFSEHFVLSVIKLLQGKAGDNGNGCFECVWVCRMSLDIVEHLLQSIWFLRVTHRSNSSVIIIIIFDISAKLGLNGRHIVNLNYVQAKHQFSIGSCVCICLGRTYHTAHINKIPFDNIKMTRSSCLLFLLLCCYCCCCPLFYFAYCYWADIMLHPKLIVSHSRHSRAA